MFLMKSNNLILDIFYSLLMDLLRDVQQSKQKYILNEYFLKWYKSEMNAWLELVVKINNMGLYFEKWLSKTVYQWSVEGTTAVEATDESRRNSLLCLLKNKLKVWIRTG